MLAQGKTLGVFPACMASSTSERPGFRPGAGMPSASVACSCAPSSRRWTTSSKGSAGTFSTSMLLRRPKSTSIASQTPWRDLGRLAETYKLASPKDVTPKHKTDFAQSMRDQALQGKQRSTKAQAPAAFRRAPDLGLLFGSEVFTRYKRSQGQSGEASSSPPFSFAPESARRVDEPLRRSSRRRRRGRRPARHRSTTALPVCQTPRGGRFRARSRGRPPTAPCARSARPEAQSCRGAGSRQ